MNPNVMIWMASWSGPGGRGDLGEQPLAQLAQRQVGRVDDDVRLGPDGLEQAALRRRSMRAMPRPSAERMAVAGLAEAPDEDVVARLEEDDARA